MHMETTRRPEPRLQRDSNGCTARHITNRHLTIDTTALTAVDVIDAPMLETLDLRGADHPAALHLRLDTVPALRQVLLPTRSEGAILHMAGETGPEQLAIVGPMASLDAAWEGVGLPALQAPDERPWLHALVTRCAARCPALTPPMQPDQPGLLLVFGETHDTPEQLTLNGDHDVAVVNVPALRRLDVHGNGSLWLRRLPALQAISGQRWCPTLQLVDTPQLTHVAPDGETLLFRQHGSTAPTLVLNGGWGRVSVNAAGLQRLRCRHVDHLRVSWCERLDDVQLPPYTRVDCRGPIPLPLMPRVNVLQIDESTVRSQLQRVAAGEVRLIPGMLAVLARAATPAQLVCSLPALAQLASLGADPEQLWAARCESAARQLRSRRGETTGPRVQTSDWRAGNRQWRWWLQDDLAQEAWSADLQVWWYACQHGVRAAIAFRDVMTRAPASPLAILAALRAASQTAADPQRVTLAVDLCRHNHNRNDLEQRHTAWTGLALPEHAGQLACQTAVDDAQRRVLLRFLLLHCQWTRLWPLVNRLLPRGGAVLRSELMLLTARSDAWFNVRLSADDAINADQARRQLRQLALTPTTASCSAAS